jgi:hypothetical protein
MTRLPLVAVLSWFSRYNKGAEVIRMYEAVLGKDGFRKGMDLYFQRHDGQAVTCDDFLAAMSDANGKDLSSLAVWYAPPPRAATQKLYNFCFAGTAKPALPSSTFHATMTQLLVLLPSLSLKLFLPPMALRKNAPASFPYARL